MRVWVNFAGMVALEIDGEPGMDRHELDKRVRKAWGELDNEEVGENADMFEWEVD